ncbi:rab-like protein 5-like isoform 1 [Lynx pardinus]|uniref:Intraflagellar transport protein 22 homolog n=1 Tax=Lynx pardinus TaxID=191816 RepID=A0A485MCZ6_LYNPA|nr:rab-like protein 5-like isoform 1 [Lynx pardinus]
MLKAKILFVGPCESGKTVLANFLTESSDITEYNPTQGVRILEFENPHVTSDDKGTACEFELWDCGGDPKFESCWPALMKDSHGVVIVFNADTPSHLKEIDMWYSCFVQQQLLQDTQCLLIAHHKPGSGSDKGNLSLCKEPGILFPALVLNVLVTCILFWVFQTSCYVQLWST